MNIDYKYYVSRNLIDPGNCVFAFVADLNFNPAIIYVDPGTLPFEGALVLKDSISDKIEMGNGSV